MSRRVSELSFYLPVTAHCRDVVVEVSKAGGMGVLGAASHSAEQLEIALNWIDQNIEGKPYGVDLIAPTSMAVTDDNATAEEILAMVLDEHRDFTRNLLARHQIDTTDLYVGQQGTSGGFLTKGRAANVVDIAFAHPIKLIANALGVPPQYMLDRGKAEGVVVAALVGAKEHATKQVEAGVDVLVAAGSEAGGHTGEVSTLVLVPEIIEAIKDHDVPVLAAGGIVTGRQMAACMALGAAGVWTGSVWLTTTEADTSPAIVEKYLQASSRQTVRARSMTGKFSRHLRSAWTEAWDEEDAPNPLPMPLQSLVSGPPMAKIRQLAETGHAGAKELVTSFVGQGVGLMNARVSSRTVVYEFMEDYLKATERLNSTIDDDG